MPGQDLPQQIAGTTPLQAADRLEAALERIAQAATAEIIRVGRDAPAPAGALPAAQIAARLDDLIARLRAVLAEGE